MTQELEFDFTSRKASLSDVEKLVAWLKRNAGFHTAAKLAASLDLSDRKVRQLAEQSDGLIVSGPGSPGYCHLHHCPIEQIDHIAATLLSQARSMIARSIRLRKRSRALIH